MTPSQVVSVGASEVYVPGHARWKLALCLCGLALFGVGCELVWTPLALFIFGGRAQAVAVGIVESRPGLPDAPVKGDGDASPGSGAIFWDEFAFQTAENQRSACEETSAAGCGPCIRSSTPRACRRRGSSLMTGGIRSEPFFPVKSARGWCRDPDARRLGVRGDQRGVVRVGKCPNHFARNDPGGADSGTL